MLITLPVSVLSHAEYSLPVIPLFGILLATFLSLSFLWCVIGPTSLPTVDARTTPDRYPQVIENARKVAVIVYQTFNTQTTKVIFILF